MFKYIQAMQGMLGLVGPLAQLIKEVEKLFTGQGLGPEKKKFVLDTVKTGLSIMNTIMPGNLPEDAIILFLDKIIDMIVAFFNMTGVFKRGEVEG